MGVAIYHQWLYDSREAWQKAISDPRWTYDMPVTRFMAIYSEYRGNSSTSRSVSSAPVVMANAPLPQAVSLAPATMAPPAPAPSAGKGSGGAPGQILSQNEIDSLLSQLSI